MMDLVALTMSCWSGHDQSARPRVQLEIETRKNAYKLPGHTVVSVVPLRNWISILVYTVYILSDFLLPVPDMVGPRELNYEPYTTILEFEQHRPK